MTTRILFIPNTQNLGCTQCAEPAMQVLVAVDEYVIEVIESQCPQHQTVEEQR